MATILQMKQSQRFSQRIAQDVAVLMSAFDVLDHGAHMISGFKFESLLKHGLRIWRMDGIEIDRENFEDQLTSVFEERVALRDPTNAPVLKMKRS